MEILLALPVVEVYSHKILHNLYFFLGGGVGVWNVVEIPTNHSDDVCLSYPFEAN